MQTGVPVLTQLAFIILLPLSASTCYQALSTFDLRPDLHFIFQNIMEKGLTNTPYYGKSRTLESPVCREISNVGADCTIGVTPHPDQYFKHHVLVCSPLLVCYCR